MNANTHSEDHIRGLGQKFQGGSPAQAIPKDALETSRLKLQMGELQRTNAELENSRNYYTALYELAPTAYITLTDEGIIAESNFAADKLFGVDHKGLIKRRFVRYVADEFKVLWNRYYLSAKQGDSIQSCELSLLRPDGSKLYAQLKCAVKQVENASPLLLITIKDIGRYKQSDEALRIAAVAFGMQDGVIVTDANKRILRVNEAFTRITGYTAEDVINQDISRICLRTYDENHYQSIWASIMNIGYWQGETWEKRKNDELFPAWLTLTAVADEDGCVSHYVGSFMDITAQKQAEKILLEARHRLENQVTTTKEELEKVKGETAEIDSALTTLRKRQEPSKTELQQALAREVEETILPFLKKLKGASSGGVRPSHLLSVLEDNLTQLASAYGCNNSVSAALKLTPLEAKVASMVRQGLPTKIIAKTLNITEGTVSIHRNHIRQKLGLNSRSDNLQIYLNTLLD